MKELEEILMKVIGIKNHSSLLMLPTIDRELVLQAIKNAYNKGVTDSAESVEVTFAHEPGDSVKRLRIDKQSILKNLIP